MGHDLPNMVGADLREADARARRVLGHFMSMGQTGGDMGGMRMAMPPNTIAMQGSPGPYGEIGMGGMFTILKVRDTLPADGSDPGWYAPPAGTVADVASDADLARDGIET
jgi:hypothetical protein